MTGHGRRAVVEIGDHGVGVPDDQIQQLLRPFTRLDTARGQANGAGLGLAIVERVITRHNAELQVRNREGGGLVLQFSFPLRAGLLPDPITNLTDMTIPPPNSSTATSNRPPRASPARPPHAGADLAHGRRHGRRAAVLQGENFQRMGAFKFRGAYNAIARSARPSARPAC
jgi:hypothetical protein